MGASDGSHLARLPTRLPVAGEGVRLVWETEIEVYTVGEIGLLETLHRDPQNPHAPSQNKCSPTASDLRVTRGEPSSPGKPKILPYQLVGSSSAPRLG